MIQEFANERRELRIRGPLLHSGMVTLLLQLEESGIIGVERIYDLCHRTCADNCVVYRQVDENGQNELKINFRENPDGSSKPMILSAFVSGKGWSLSHSQILIKREILPETYLRRLSDREVVLRSREIIDHPYLAGAWTRDAVIKDREVILALNRGKTRHVLGPNGIEKFKFSKGMEK